MAVTGLRPGEVMGIQKSDIKEDFLTIIRAINVRNIITVGKNKNARRNIALHDIAKSILTAQIEKSSNLNSIWVFCNPVGNHGTQSGMYDAWQRLAKEKELPGSPYTLRHTFISMVKNDMPTMMLKSIIGHSASMDTFGIYGHEVTGEVEQSKKILDITFQRHLKQANDKF